MRLALDGGDPVRSDYLVFGRPCIGEEEIEEVVDTLRSRWIGTGPRTAGFEREFAEYVGAAHAVAVNSCTAGLHLALTVRDIGPGDEVVVPSMTFAASVNVIVHCGARPRFVDVDPERLTLDPDLVGAAVEANPGVRAVLAVHFGGLAADLDALAAAAGRPLIEDAAHAVTTRYRGRMIGSHGNLASFSFYANKNLTTAEGGMLTFHEPALEPRLRALRLHGMHHDAWKRYQSSGLVHTDVIEAGWKYNMTDLQAALGIHQLRKQERFVARREELARRYDAAFDDLPEVRRQHRPADLASDRHALHLYVLVLELDRLEASRDQVVTALRAENIGAGIHYRPVHLEPYYRQAFPQIAGTLPVTERIGRSVLTLPLTPDFSDRDADDVIAAVTKVVAAYRR